MSSLHSFLSLILRGWLKLIHCALFFFHLFTLNRFPTLMMTYVEQRLLELDFFCSAIPNNVHQLCHCLLNRIIHMYVTALQWHWESRALERDYVKRLHCLSQWLSSILSTSSVKELWWEFNLISAKITFSFPMFFSVFEKKNQYRLHPLWFLFNILIKRVQKLHFSDSYIRKSSAASTRTQWRNSELFWLKA